MSSPPLRFAFAGLDRSRGVFDALVAAGWEPVAMFSMPTDNRHDSNQEIVELAAQRRLPMQLSRIVESDLDRLRQCRCDVLVVAGYGWKIPDWTPYLRHAINFHPAPLPEGRGPYPPMRALLEQKPVWAISCHKIAPDFDTGDMLAAESFQVAGDACHETLQLQLQMASRRLAALVAANFHDLWRDGQPQQGSSYWPRVSDAERTLDFTQPVAAIMRVVRACGLCECLVPLKGGPAHVRRAEGWQEAHDYPVGQVVHAYRQWLVIAARDGFIALIEWTFVAPPMRDRMGF